LTGTVEQPLRTGRYLLLANPPVGVPLRFALELPATQLLLRHRTRDIRVGLRGDEVVAMDNFAQKHTFFDPID
jgi:hypothetical protein